jgi:hypothetical protein
VPPDLEGEEGGGRASSRVAGLSSLVACVRPTASLASGGAPTFTLRLGRKLAPRCAVAGIRIALVGPRGEVEDVEA